MPQRPVEHILSVVRLTELPWRRSQQYFVPVSSLLSADRSKYYLFVYLCFMFERFSGAILRNTLVLNTTHKHNSVKQVPTSLLQGCPKYGPRPKYGPQSSFLWPKLSLYCMVLIIQASIHVTDIFALVSRKHIQTKGLF